ncbi:MAG: LicD family protein [Chloroflexi bacterium]|nr:LicD family protein [Chloroflexota bacterium]
MASSNGADEAALERSYRVLQPVDAATAERILKETKRILDQHDVVFFLRQGTCLGAIRDNGFITWDDDLDLGSVIGLHGFTEKSIDPVVTALRANGYFVKVDLYDHYVSVTTMKASLRTDWACYKILDDSIFHFPGTRIPVRLLTQLKEIDFIGEKFLVPNPPEEYLQFKYGPDWMTPKETGYEKDILQMIPPAPIPGRPGRLRQFLGKHILPWRACGIRVLDLEGEPVSGADVVVPGLGRFSTNNQGYTKFYLPGEEWYSLVISYGNHEELLYMETLAPGGSYVYRPDRSVASGRLCALSTE